MLALWRHEKSSIRLHTRCRLARMAQARPETFKSRQSQTEIAISYLIAPPKSFPR